MRKLSRPMSPPKNMAPSQRVRKGGGKIGKKKKV